jgi:hypothetical protein
MRYRTAIRAPPPASAEGAVTAPAFRSSPRDVTIGMRASSGAIRETTVTCGATMTTPSTSWPSRSSAAAAIADGEADDRWTTDEQKPRSRAASSITRTLLACPLRDPASAVSTPMMCDRRVPSILAARFGR